MKLPRKLKKSLKKVFLNVIMFNSNKINTNIVQIVSISTAKNGVIPLFKGKKVDAFRFV